MFVPTVKLLQAAEDEGYTLARFSVYNLESVQAIIEAAEESSSPVVLSVYEGFMQGLPPGYLESLIKFAGAETEIPMSFYLDHVTSLEICARSIRQGYSSVMIDASLLPYEDNVALTSKVVEFAHAAGVAVEGEVGVIARGGALTDPDQAKDFVERTQVDALAVSIGEYSGFYDEPPELDFERLRRIKEQVDCFLVLHGASGLSEEVIHRSMQLGIRHIGFGTSLRNAFFSEVDMMRKKHGAKVVDPRRILWPAKDAMKAEAMVKLRMVGSVGKAKAFGRVPRLGLLE